MKTQCVTWLGLRDSKRSSPLQVKRFSVQNEEKNRNNFIISGDCQSRLWEVGPTDLTLIRTFKGHSRSVKTVSYRNEDPHVFATGGRDGAILIWDTRASQSSDLINRAENCIFRGHDDHEHRSGTPSSSSKRSTSNNLMPNACKSSITGLAFQDDFTLISCGAGDGIIKIWDLRRNYSCYKKEPLPKFSLPYAGTSTFKGFTNLTVDLDRFRLYVSCMDNTIYCYNISTYNSEPIQRYKGLKNGSYYIRTCLSEDGQYLLSGSSDERAYVWNVNNPFPVITLEGHEVEVSCVAWSRTNDFRLVTSSDDAFLKIWRLAPDEISEDDKRLYHGHAVLSEENRLIGHGQNHPDRFLASKLGDFLTTPSSGKTAQKRSFAELADSSASCGGSSKKRARRLFPEEDLMKCRSQDSPIKQLKLSPLSERLNLNEVYLTPSSLYRVPLTFASPTSNLPNYVLNGEAPHLPTVSPKRKLKENMDWLTKIRKQKLLHSPSLQHFSDDLSPGNSPSTSKRAASPCPNSPKVHGLFRYDSPKSSRCTARSNSTNCSNQDGVNSSPIFPKTPSSSRRNSSTTTPTSNSSSIRRFLKATSKLDDSKG